MYNEFFGLKSTPFAIAPDPHYLYMSGQHQDALAYLIYGIKGNGGFVLLTGDVGTGKTTLCRCMLEHLPDKSDVAFILNPTLNSQELLASICDELGINYDHSSLRIKTLSDAIYRHLLQSHAAGRSTILVIDEAQNLEPEVLEQMRLLTNLETNEKKLLQIIMFGQPELRELINSPALQQLAQRITARFHLEPLKAEDTSHYIEHRLTVSGYKKRANQEDIIPTALYKRIHQLSSGIPRLINILCDRALMGAYARNQDSISPRVLGQAAKEVFGYRSTLTKPTMTLVKPLSLGLACIFIVLLVLKFFPDTETKARQLINQLTKYNEIPIIEQYQSGISLEEPAALPIKFKSTNENVNETQDHAPSSMETVADSSSQFAPIKLHSAQKETQQLTPDDNNRIVQQVSTLAAKQEADAIRNDKPGTVITATQKENHQSLKQESSYIAVQQVENTELPQQTSLQLKPQVSVKSTVENAPITPASITDVTADTATDMKTENKEEAAALLSSDLALRRDHSPENRAYKALFRLWNISLDNNLNPCRYATQQGLRCLHKQDNLLQLLKSNRPALIRIINNEGLISTLALIEISEELATLSDGITVWQIPLNQLKQKKIINFTLLWRPPEGYRGFVKAGDSGPTVLWLKQQMAKLTPLFQSEMDNQFDPRLSLYVKAFQHSQNLNQDGIAGPETLIRLNTLLADDIPVLLSYREP